jgi:TatD DNase family protein
MFVLSVTTTPSAWAGTDALSESLKRVRTAIGLHPQLAAERKGELSLFEEILPRTRYVGEVGLDGGHEFRSTWDVQVNVLTHILKTCSLAGGKILSLHSRRATSAVLSHLERWPDCGVPVLHWFSGTIQELERAKEMTCWFSVGPAMLLSKKGRDIASRLPINRVLTETDGPFAQVGKQPLKPWDVSIAVHALSEIWNRPESDIRDILLDNLKSLTATI